ncbi:hypothetical protein [Actinoplanes regularis]|uniref:Uncharacterized protein n=1 Tax=Actinoplanes regularis TaxID=52697 RepID=A0A238ZR19_9ACTN|nr:hypothetical protein [Actinoplanes regularis]GIE87502.1 hypothetical protein Are01nite_39820 [Actinoplanes regularis]SNR85592.1 hypothetical protein SAMN06264365_106227 [Actinoplanes regularis]
MDATSSANNAKTQLVQYQQQLAKDLAAKATAKVIAADRAAVTKAEQAVQQAKNSTVATTSTSRTAATGSMGTTVDVTV